MSKSNLILISVSSAVLGGTIVALAIWVIAYTSGILDATQPDLYGAGKGYEILAEHQCKFGETKTIIMRGEDDDFALGNYEPEQINEQLSHFPGIHANFPARRDYDEGGQDKIISDYFDVPSNISNGVFVTRVKPASPKSASFGNDTLQIGHLKDRDFNSYNVEHHAFHSYLDELDMQPGWVKLGDIYSAAFKHIIYRSNDGITPDEVTRSYSNLLEQQRASSPVSRIDFVVADDTRVDFSGVAYCEYPETKRGLTFMNSPTFDAAMPDFVVLACDSDPESKWCNPMYGDTDCGDQHPLACFLDENTSIPDLEGTSSTARVWLERYWGGGKVAFTEPVPGTRFKTLTEVNDFCASVFGKKWRVLAWHDSALRGVAGRLHGKRYQGRVWIDIKDQPNGTCWAREATP